MPRLLRDVNSPSPDRGFPELGPAMEAMHLQQYGLQDSDAPRTPGGSRIEHDREYSNSSQHGSSGSAETNPERPTNIGSAKHPHECRPCAFVFRISGGELRNRCSNGDACVFCHDPSHPRVRGRRRGKTARGHAGKEDLPSTAGSLPGPEDLTCPPREDLWKLPSTGTETPPFGWSFNVPRLAPMPPPQGDDLHFLSSLSAATESMNHLALWNKMSLEASQDPRQPAVGGWP